jgi:glycine cleavage system regulatory protein
VATLVLTVIGTDRAGLVEALAGPIADHGGNWDRSHMARLAGQFAGIVVVTIPDANTDALAATLAELTARGTLDVRVALAGADDDRRGGTDVMLHLIGQDRPGIVKEIANALAGRGVSIDELETSTGSAPMSGELLFEATATLHLPPTVSTDDLCAALEDLADELMVDVDVSETVSSP